MTLTPLRFASACDGISSVRVAWRRIAWHCAWVSEIDPFCIDVCEHHYPCQANLGDMLALRESQLENYGRVDLLVGGTPCQSFSIAGVRTGLDDARGNLALRFVQLASVLQPRWVLWENVPGVLSSNGGRDFGSIVGALARIGYGWAYRVLDAQFFRLAQQRRRVFLVGYRGNYQRAAAVLFDSTSVQGHSPARIQARPGARAGSASGGASGRERGPRSGRELYATHAKAPTILARDAKGINTTITTPIIACPIKAGTLCGGAHPGGFNGQDAANLIAHEAGRVVRRLTPREWERLQGFPDDYTHVPIGRLRKHAKDAPRYRALGNSMAVPVMEWLGRRIAAVDAMEIHDAA